MKSNIHITSKFVCPACVVTVRNPFVSGKKFSREDGRAFRESGYIVRLCPSCSEELIIFASGNVIAGFPDGHGLNVEWTSDDGVRHQITTRRSMLTCRMRERVEVRKRWHQGLSTHQIRKETGIPLTRVEKLCRKFQGR